jgi:hypothetical protein
MANITTRADKGAPLTNAELDANFTDLNTELGGKEPTIAAGTAAQYRRGDKTWRDFFTDVRATTLTGLSTVTNAAIAAGDTVLSAMGKLQKQITDLTASDAAKLPTSGGTMTGPLNVITQAIGNNTTLAASTEFVMASGMMRRTALGAGIDLNTILEEGIYLQGTSANAANGTNYPAPHSGTLLVLSHNKTATSALQQIYLAGNTNVMYLRSLISGAWSAWATIASMEAVAARLGDTGSAMFRNRIINGEMRIDQHNSGNVVGVTAAVFGVDRWRVGAAVTGKLNAQQGQSITSSEFYCNSLVIWNPGTAYNPVASDYFYMDQLLEAGSVADLVGKPVTVSFTVKAPVAGEYGVALSLGNRSCLQTYTVNAANVAERKTITFPADAAPNPASPITGASMGGRLVFDLGSGSSTEGAAGAWGAITYFRTAACKRLVSSAGNYVISGVQLEAGSAASPFERRQHALELALCHRYYKRYKGSIFMGSGVAVSSTLAYMVLNHTVPMRGPISIAIEGTVDIYAAGTVGAHTVTSVGVNYSDTNGTVAFGLNTAATMSPGSGAALFTSSGAITLKSEL